VSTKVLIEVDKHTADALQMRAAELGVTTPSPTTREEYREVVLQVLGGTYALQYRYDGGTILMLRVFHGSETR